MVIASRLEACTSVTVWLGGQRALLLMLIIWKTDVWSMRHISAKVIVAIYFANLHKRDSSDLQIVNHKL